MKKTIIWVIALTFLLTSCQIKAENTAPNQIKAENTTPNINTNSPDNTVRMEDLKPITSPAAKAVRGINAKVGVVDLTEDRMVCFRTKNADLTKNTPVSIVVSIYEPPQKVFEAVVEKKLEKSCVERDSDAGEGTPEENSYYSLVLTDMTIDKSEIDVGIGIVQPAEKVQVENKLANVDLTGDGKPEYFRQCGSSEGLHLTIWSGKPLIGKRIWHYYYYLHYEIVPDCRKKDWEGAED
jgi:hypothetical protein